MKWLLAKHPPPPPPPPPPSNCSTRRVGATNACSLPFCRADQLKRWTKCKSNVITEPMHVAGAATRAVVAVAASVWVAVAAVAAVVWVAEAAAASAGAVEASVVV